MKKRAPGILRRVLEANGGSLTSQTVLSKQTDPYRLDTPAGYRDGKWFARQFERALFRAGSRTMHIRGVHYAVVMADRTVLKPDGTSYRNTDDDWFWLLEQASKAARWLGLVPFDSIRDQRSAEPVIHSSPSTAGPASPIGRASGARVWLDPPACLFAGPSVDLSGFYTGGQPYHLVIFGEKASLAEAVIPAARRFHADVYLGPGDASDTRIYEIVRSNAEDGRPLRLFCLCDFDPSGWNMPVAIARKLQALRDLEFPDLDFEVRRIGLTAPQVRALLLPSTPLKETERRADRSQAAWGGLAQTEVDALVMRPEVLDRMVSDALAPFYDRTLSDRAARAERLWRDEAERLLAAATDADAAAIAALQARAETAVEEAGRTLAETIAAIDHELAQLERAIELPPPPAVPEPRINRERQAFPLISSAWDWAEQTERLRLDKRYDSSGDEP